MPSAKRAKFATWDEGCIGDLSVFDGKLVCIKFVVWEIRVGCGGVDGLEQSVGAFQREKLSEIHLHLIKQQ